MATSKSDNNQPAKKSQRRRRKKPENEVKTETEEQYQFNPDDLHKMVIALPLFNLLAAG